MPFLHLSLSARPSPALTTQVATLLTDLTTQLLRKDARLVAIVVDYVDPDHWLVAGRTLAEQRLTSFFLALRLTDGTNTPAEKAAYQQQVFARLGELLGPVHPVSYVCIHDVRAEAHGYGGLSQAQRAGRPPGPTSAASGPLPGLGPGLHVPVE